MSATTNRRFVNPLLGTYFGIFASVIAALVLMLLILELLGVSGALIRTVMLLGPIVLYVAVGAAGYSRQPVDFFAAGRRVPAVYSGLVLAGSAAGATGLVAITGLFFISGSDAWCLPIGFWGGFVAMALLTAPYLRKFGAYTVPTYLGRRLESRMVRLMAAGVMLVPMVLVAAAELRMGAFAAAWLSGASQPAVTLLLVAGLLATVLLGGMRSLSWSNTGQAIVALLALAVPVAIVAALETNLPLPQLSHGPVLRSIGRLEAMQGVPMPQAAAFAINLPGLGLETFTHRMAHPHASVGPAAFVLLMLTIMCGVAAAPWLLPRCGCTPGVYEARKSTAWAIFFCGLAMLTAASVAVFFRDIVMDQIVGKSPAGLPAWFEQMRALGLAGIDGKPERIPLTAIGFKRDAVLFALPIATGFPQVVLHMALAGVIAAALLGASAVILALGTMLAEDGVNGLVPEPPAPLLRINIARASIGAVGVIAGWVAIFVPADPLDLMLWAFALTASAGFPIVVLSVWWKRLNALGAAAGMAGGFGVAVLAILAGEAAWLGLPGTLAAVFGLPAGFVAAIAVTKLTAAPDRRVLALVRDMRLPGGETMEDRTARLHRLKQRRPT